MGLGSTWVFQVQPAVLSRIQGRLSFWSILASSPRMCTCRALHVLLDAAWKARDFPAKCMYQGGAHMRRAAHLRCHSTPH